MRENADQNNSKHGNFLSSHDNISKRMWKFRRQVFKVSCLEVWETIVKIRFEVKKTKVIMQTEIILNECFNF